MSDLADAASVDLEEQDGSREERVRLKAPRSIWLDALLFFVTFGFYSLFWLPARVRELNRAGKGPFVPWLWFLVPFLWIAQLFALPRFLSAFMAWGKEHDVRISAFKRTVAVALVVLSSIFFMVSDRLERAVGVELPYYSLLIGWLALTLGYTLLADVVHQVISALPSENYEFNRRRAGYGWAEWIFVALLTPLAALGVYGLLLQTSIGGRTLDPGQIFENELAGFRLTLAGENWREIPAGTFGDADSATEFQGPLNDQVLIVYSYPGSDQGMDSFVQWRLKEWVGSGFRCEENRQWSHETTSPMSFTECSLERLGGYRAVQVMNILVHEERVLELIGFMEAAPAVVDKHRSDFVETAQSLEAL